MRIWGERRPDGTLKPYARWREALEDFPVGERLRINVDRDRNGKFSALYHVMLSLIARAINRGPATTDVDALKRWVKLKKGWYEVVALPHPRDGVTHAIDFKSTAFASMGEEEFRQFALDTCEAIRAELAPWLGDAPEFSEAMTIINTIAPRDAA